LIEKVFVLAIQVMIEARYVQELKLDGSCCSFLVIEYHAFNLMLLKSEVAYQDIVDILLKLALFNLL
jgi:hypothetical protein